jgi:pimeloyl-ACP methyl ester carboxylesterase
VRAAQAKRPLGQRIPRLPIAQGAAKRRTDFASKDAAVEAYRGRGAFATWQGAFLADYVEDGFRANGNGGVALTCAAAWEAATFASLRHYAAALLARVKQPVTILKAETVSAVRLPTEKLTGFKPDLVVETVAGSTHFLPMEQPDLVRDRLRAALAARQAGAN